jgi:phosphosulfolactate synthase (CoM biosynthesis protein A)
MHRIESTRYGYKLVLEGFLQREEVGMLLEDMKKTIQPAEKGKTFPLLMDLRKSRAVPADARELMKEAILFCKEVGMERNAVVLSSAIATLQARRLGKETGVDRWARYIDASRPDWEKLAFDWLVHAKDPEGH